MAGLRGNNAWVAWQIQTAFGTPAVLAKGKAVKSPYAGGSFGPVREIGNLAETDANRDQGVAYVKKDGSQGSPEIYVRGNVASLLAGAIGKDTTSGASPKFIHTIIPENTLSYYTFWSMLSSTLYEIHKDCIISDVNIKGTAGSPITATATVVGTQSERSTTDPLSGAEDPGLEKSTVYTFSMAELKLGAGAETHLISSIDLTVANNATAQQTDDVAPLDIAVGKREISLGFDLFFTNLEEYNNFHYGSPTGTELAPGIYETSFTAKFKIDADNSIEIKIPSLAYQEFPLTPNVDGNPVVIPVKAVSQRPSSGNIIEAIVKNSHDKYA